MKASIALLTFSVLTNTYLIYPQDSQTELAASKVSQPVPEVDSPSTAIAAANSDTLAQLLQGEDPLALKRELERLNFPKERREAMLRAFVYARMELRFPRPVKGDRPPTPYWMTEKAEPNTRYADRRKAEAEEFKALGLENEKPHNLHDSEEKPYAFLSPATQAVLLNIEKDYEEMTEGITKNARNFWLKSDHEKLQLLRGERKADIEAVLTPDEKEQIALHGSPASWETKRSFGEIVSSEDEFKRLFRLQVAREEAASRARKETDAGRSKQMFQEATRAYEAGVLGVLGESRIAQLQQAYEPDQHLIAGVTKRFNLGEDAAPKLKALRTTATAESRNIAASTGLTESQRSKAFEALRARLTADAKTLLGAEAGETYLERTDWMETLKEDCPVSLIPERQFGCFH